MSRSQSKLMEPDGADGHALPAAYADLVVHHSPGFLVHVYCFPGAYRRALATAGAGALVDCRPKPPVLVHLAACRGTAHGQVLDRAPEPCHAMSFDMGEHDHARRGENVTGDLHLAEMFAFDRDFPEVVADQAVCNDHRSPDDGIVEAMLDSRDQVVNRVVSAA